MLELVTFWGGGKCTDLPYGPRPSAAPSFSSLAALREALYALLMWGVERKARQWPAAPMGASGPPTRRRRPP